MAGAHHVLHRGGKGASVVLDSDKLRKLFGAQEEAEGMTIQEIAEKTGFHRDTINKKMRRMIQCGAAKMTGTRTEPDTMGRMVKKPVYVFSV